ncbi:hypothetical protein SAY87_015576 [Trapa incisa]|uniref:ABC transporter domain-containing protein n=1 Tax=Trapa incisa TaxID=236973 RepID=A0AAN7LDF8_9MYRT|nr:hypothetical protein SAY87_015576 [Trapa incisa]
MAKLSGKVGHQILRFGGNGAGQILAAAAVVLLFCLFSGPGSALFPEDEEEELLSGGNGKDFETDGGNEGGGAPAVGKVYPVTIRWAGICCSVSDKSNKSVRFLLEEHVSGEAKPGRLLAIMGASGSGKTTLLNVLAGLLEINGRPKSSKFYRFAYIRQEDIFFSQLTVRETLSLAAELQLPNTSSPEVRVEYVNNLLSRLGLVGCADTNVGDAKVRGISGGEKKRLSLACELIVPMSPRRVWVSSDTLTTTFVNSGLDAFQAEKVMETLRQLAQDGHTVICSIHQPRGSVYYKFDDIVLLTEGALVYACPARDEPLEHFSKFGFSCPDHVNPAEFLADLISIDFSSSESQYTSRKRIDSLVESFLQQMTPILYATPMVKREKLKTGMIPTKRGTIIQEKGWWKQFCLLLKRAWKQASRDGPTNKVRTRMSVASAIIFGSIFWRMGKSQSSIQDLILLILGFLSHHLAAINTAMAALTKTIRVFPKERTIVDRERAKGSYVLGPYLLSKLLAEIPTEAAFPLMFGTILYPMAGLNPSLSR